jgi:DNA-binding response OmpR family regulator
MIHSTEHERHPPGGDRPPLHFERPAACDTPAYRVLVVDDDRDCAESLGLLVRLWGYEARLAYDGPGAVRLARECRPGAVLLDIGLGGMSGFEVARRLRQEFGPGVLLVAVTGFGHQESRRLGREAGLDAYLLKPADLDQLRALLGRSRARRA